jgi:hypothetical protein
MDPIHAVGSQLTIERPDPNVARRRDPHAASEKRPRPRGAHVEGGEEQQAEPEPRAAGSEPEEPRIVGSRLDVLA